MSRPTTVPTRRRSIATASTPIPVPPEVKILVRETFLNNKEANAAARSYEKSRKELLKAMKEAKLKTVEVQGKLGVCPPLVATVAEGESFVVDCKALMGLVGEEMFYKIVTATKGKIVQHVGESIFLQVSETVPTAENVSVKEGK